MLKRLVLVVGVLVAIVMAADPLCISLVKEGSVVAAKGKKCEKCGHKKCPGDCTKCPTCQKKAHKKAQ